MTTPTSPGVPIFSDEWFTLAATEVPDHLRPAVLALCRAYQLGDSRDPNIVAGLIQRNVGRFDPFLALDDAAKEAAALEDELDELTYSRDRILKLDVRKVERLAAVAKSVTDSLVAIRRGSCS